MPDKLPSNAYIGMDLNSILSQKKKGTLSFALNAQTEGFDGEAVTYQNEQANEECLQFPEGYVVIGKKSSVEFDIMLFWLVNPLTGDSEIGKVMGKSCLYERIINSRCLNHDINHPILKAEIKKINNTIQVYWTDAYNNRRFLDLNKLPYKRVKNLTTCETVVTTEIDCNELNVQPNFSIPEVNVISVDSDGELIAGDYQFAVQYANAASNGFTSLYGITNPTPVNDPLKVIMDFNYQTNKSITFEVTNIDTTGIYDYINIIVIETINNISTAYLVNTYKISDSRLVVIYTGANRTQIKLSTEEIFEKFPIYNKANDLTAVQDILVWAGLTTDDEINFQKIANQISLQWQTYKLSARDKNTYANSINTSNLEGYMGDETYALEFTPYLTNGEQLRSFHIPGRKAVPSDLEVISNRDVINQDGSPCTTPENGLPRWRVYNTANKIGISYPSGNCGGNPSSGGESTIAATITTRCSDDDCSVQGFVSLDITFSTPLTESCTLLIGEINIAASVHYASGFNIYTLPSGAVVNAYYADPGAPFQMVIPAGTTSITIPANIYQEGQQGNNTDGAWICHSCLFPITDLYIKAVTPSNTQIVFSTGQDINIHNIYTPSTTPPPIPSTTPCIDDCYSGPWEYGEFAYTESSETYPCNPDIWGELSGKPIRHHKFPDSTVTHIHDNQGNIYPKGIRIDIDQIKALILASDLSDDIKSRIAGFKIVRANRASNKSVIAKGLINNVGVYNKDSQNYFYPNYPFNDLRADPFIARENILNNSGNVADLRLKGFATDESKKRFTLHSPDTSFYQPFLGSQLKLETVEYGKSAGHFAEVLNHSKYKVLTFGAYATALTAAIVVGFFSGTYGLSNNVFSGSAAFAAYQTILDVIDKLVPRKNYAYQFNSVGDYTSFKPVPNDTGNKIRFADIATYIIPGITTAGDIHTINNFQRETSVYVRTTDTLPFTQDFGAPEDQSRFILSDEGNCDQFTKVVNKDISSYYASLKRAIPNQYGPIYSYEVIDTGFYQDLDVNSTTVYGTRTIFGGDTFINKFAYKSKLPLFIDNRVNFVDDADVFYNEIGNIGYPIFWFSTDSESGAGGGLFSAISQFLGVKVNNLDCKGSKFFYQTGKFYLFAYGIPYFFCESDVNVDFRQAYNDKEGDFFPHVGTGIPDDWLQEKNVTIKQDNTYTYNKTFSKQNKENVFTHLPEDYLQNLNSDLTNTAIFSEKQVTSVNSRVNNWLIYRPVSKFDFPLNYGKLTAIDGIENRQVLARFEKKSLVYNALLTAPTSAADVYLGQSMFSQQVPPLDFAETDLGYNGSQHKFLLKTEFGMISVDAQRGQVFLLGGNKATDISGEDFKVDQFFTTYLDFVIQDYFPDVNIDNHFNGIGLHGVYDNKYNRFLLTKLDYQPLVDGIIHSNGKFYLNETQIFLSNRNYFCNKSFTISFDFDNKAWISFHSYLPNFYLGSANFFYTGLNGSPASLWRHNTAIGKYNNFYGKIEPYVIEYPQSYQYEDEILQSISDYTKVNKYFSAIKFTQTNDIYFSKSIIYNDQQCTGILQLNPKLRNNLYQMSQYPKYNTDNKGILFTKSGSFYNYNTIYDAVIDQNEPIFQESCNSLSEGKVLNTANLDYGNRSFQKYSIRAKDCRIRHILDDRDDCRFISQFIVTETQKSFK